MAVLNRQTDAFTPFWSAHSGPRASRAAEGIAAPDPHPDQDRYVRLIERCVDAVFLLHDQRVVGANRAAARLAGASTGEHLLGQSLSTVLRMASTDAPDGIRLDLEPGDCPSSHQRKLILPDQSVIDAEITVVPYPDQKAQPGHVIVVRDVSARRHITAALCQQDKYLQLITDIVPALIAYVDRDRRFRFVNATYESWFAVPRNAIRGERIEQILGVAYEDIHGYVEQALSGRQVSFEARLALMPKARDVMAVFTPDMTEDGGIAGFSSMMMDITERKRDEQVLREQAGQLRTVTDAVPVFIAQCDRSYRLRFANKTYLDHFGLKPDQIIGHHIAELVGEPAFAPLRQHLDVALSGEASEHEVRVPVQHGKWRVMRLMYVPDRDEHGEVRGLIAAATDVTDLRETEDRLHRREREFKALVENSPDIIARIDRKMRHLYVNPSVEKLSGLKADVWIGKTIDKLGLPDPVVQAWQQATRTALADGTEQKLVFEYGRDDGMRYFSGRVVPEVDRSGRIDSVVVIAYDVTERARMEKERDELLARERQARIQAETAARARDQFLAIVSHELRAPLNGIQSWAHVLENYVKEAMTAPLAQRALQGIKTGVAQQVRLIEDLLDVTRMMSGKLRLVRQPLPLLPTLQAAVESVRPAAAAKHISIACTYRITNEQIEGDADRIQQIFWNLLSNAVKFTQEEGNVWVTASNAEREICVTIRDDGAGIPPEFLPHLFDRFSQADTSSTRSHSGLGLGLFLVRHLVELHGGRVSAESAGPGSGTTFSVHFPLRVRSQKHASVTPYEYGVDSPLPLPTLEGLRILLVDDQEEARESLTAVLSSVGAHVHAAASGREAQQWLESQSESELPDVLVCDIAMPGEDGYSTLRRLRTWRNARGEHKLAKMPALALTAFAHREDRIRALTAGFQMHVTKPVAAEELIVVIDTMVGPRRTASPS